VESVTEDILVEELFPIAVRANFAIPVIDDKRRLLGRITADQIFESLTMAEGGAS